MCTSGAVNTAMFCEFRQDSSCRFCCSFNRRRPCLSRSLNIALLNVLSFIGENNLCLSEHIKGSRERLFIRTQTHNLQIFGVIPLFKLQNDT